jgi:D-beta-D-heptose 7-phosphate kinase/D-beta-D-heptose 1-phosphate adenosyltransferase
MIRRDGPLLVIGDALLDHDLDGTATQLASEAPVPVVENPTTLVRPGGAALAALLAAQTGRLVTLAMPIGEHDPASVELRRLLDRRVRLVPLPLAGTPAEKIRIRTRGRTLVRLDRGGGACGEPGTEVFDAIRQAAAILVSDHGGGTTSDPTLRELLAERAALVPLLWDPHPRGADPVEGTMLAMPNLSEALGAADVRWDEPDAAAQAARVLLERWPVAGVCMTLGADGALLTFNGNNPLLAPVPRAYPGDVSGRGAAFAAALALALLGGHAPATAVTHAVNEASAFVESGGAAALSDPDTPAAPSLKPSPMRRPGSVRAALAAVEAARAGGAQIVATGGSFDVLHAGHLSCLQAARALGDFLVVCLNSDASVRRLKGRGRPINKVADRVAMLSALECVDAVAVFGEDSPTVLLDRIRPDLWVKGGDHTGLEPPESALVASWGGRVATVPYLNGHSSKTMFEALGSVVAGPARSALSGR